MLRKRSHKIILFLIIAELILDGVILVAQRPLALGIQALTTSGPTTSQGSVAPQVKQPAPQPLGQALPSPTATRATVLQANAPITFIAPSPTLSPIRVVSPAPSLAPHPIASPAINPLPTGQTVVRPQASRMVIRSIGVDSAVVEMGYTIREQNGEEVADWQIPENAVGHMIGSANPGAVGNIVLSGHNNILGAVFRKLYTFRPGDEVTLFNTKGTGFIYRVTKSYIVEERGTALAQRLANAQVLLPTADARLTLVSCWPETDNSNRAIVIAEPAGAAQ